MREYFQCHVNYCLYDISQLVPVLLLVKQMSRISLTQSTKVCNLSPLFEPRDVKNILLTFFFWSVLLVMEPRFFRSD